MTQPEEYIQPFYASDGTHQVTVVNDPAAFIAEQIVKRATDRVKFEMEGELENEDDVYSEPDWAEYVMRFAGEFIADLAADLGNYFTPYGTDSAARQAWLGEDFNYGGDRPGWNYAFLYNASEGMISLIRSTAYAFARRGWLPPHSVGKNHSDFDPEKGGSLA